MHIGFDISQTGAGKAGCGYFAHAMIEAMLDGAPDHRYDLYPSFGDFYFDPDMPAASPYPGRHVSYGPRHASLEQARAFWNQDPLDRALGTPDVVHANNFWCPTGLHRSRLIFTLYDLAFITNPSWTTELNRAGCSEGVSRAALHADWIVAISEATRAHARQAFPDFPNERIRVVYPCSRFSDAHAQGAPPAALAGLARQPFWLSVGTIEPRKNQQRIVEALARYLALGGAPVKLVFAGGQGWLMDDFREFIERAGMSPHIVLAGYVSDEELIWLYRNCAVNIYVSCFEGFGLPVLEGMQFGAPTIASSATSLPEVAGDAAILVAPEDTEGIARELLGLSRSPAQRDALSSAALTQAARFDARASAARLLDLYAEAAATPKRQAPSASGIRGWTRRLMGGTPR